MDYAIGLYKNPSCQSIGIEWGIILANLIENWGEEIEIVESTINNNPNHLITFYQHCVKRGFNEAKGKLDPWYLLANSDEKHIISKALRKWYCDYRLYDCRNYDVYNLKNKLAIQILDFLQNLKNQGVTHRGWINSPFENYYLSQEKEIITAVFFRWVDANGRLHYLNGQFEQLQEMCKTNDFARYVLNNPSQGYLECAKYLVRNVFLARLLGDVKNIPQNLQSPIEKFLSDPEHFSSTEYSDLGRFLYALSTICSIKGFSSVYSEAKSALSGVPQIYINEKLYVLAIAHFYESRNIYILKQDLHDIKSNYPPAEYMWNWYHKSVRRDNIVKTHIEDFSTLKQHICYVVRHLEDKKFV